MRASAGAITPRCAGRFGGSPTAQIGQIVATYNTYNSGSVDRYQSGISQHSRDLEWQLRPLVNYLAQRRHIVEQAVHSIDRRWAMGDNRRKSASATAGARFVRKTGNIFDHFEIV